MQLQQMLEAINLLQAAKLFLGSAQFAICPTLLGFALGRKSREDQQFVVPMRREPHVSGNCTRTRREVLGHRLSRDF